MGHLRGHGLAESELAGGGKRKGTQRPGRCPGQLVVGGEGSTPHSHRCHCSRDSALGPGASHLTEQLMVFWPPQAGPPAPCRPVLKDAAGDYPSLPPQCRAPTAPQRPPRPADLSGFLRPEALDTVWHWGGRGLAPPGNRSSSACSQPQRPAALLSPREQMTHY
ncbi:hypothetical protein H1C71_021335 [Ictidomys tridecemlineatus]|nr:hypothetical protein H1C71_021335 [Ictidomys tridecemlineatus]